MTDDAVRPDHYKLILNGKEIQCIDVIEALGLGFHLGSALKYAWRFGRKHDRLLEEVGKCRWYLDRWWDAVACEAARPSPVRSIWLALHKLVMTREEPTDGRVVTLANEHEMLVGNLRGMCCVAEENFVGDNDFDPRPYMLELIELYSLEEFLCA